MCDRVVSCHAQEKVSIEEVNEVRRAVGLSPQGDSREKSDPLGKEVPPMQEISYEDATMPDVAALVDLYGSVGWSAYTDSPETLLAAIAGSSRVVCAWSGELLVGLARVITDGATIWYLQDILVRPDFHRHGIGRQLVTRAMDGYGEVRQKVLLTDDEVAQKAFYESLGFVETGEVPTGALRTFVRFN